MTTRTRMTQSQFKSMILEQVKGEYEVKSTFLGVNKKVHLLHSCGYDWYVTPNHWKRGQRCPKCAHKLPITDDDFANNVRLNGNGEYTKLSKYKNSKTKVHLRHKCGYDWYVTPDVWNRGSRCPKCAGRPKIDTKEYKRRVAKLTDDYEVIGEYVNRRTKIKMRHVSENHIFETSPDEFLKGNRCPICRMSYNEIEISEWLSNHNINYSIQKHFDDCRDKLPLPFDFYLPDMNVCIEYDGIQHYEPIAQFGGEKKLKLRQKHDLIKDEFCKQQGIELIRIPYTDDISATLNNRLNILTK